MAKRGGLHANRSVLKQAVSDSVNRSQPFVARLRLAMCGRDLLCPSVSSAVKRRRWRSLGTEVLQVTRLFGNHFGRLLMFVFVFFSD